MNIRSISFYLILVTVLTVNLSPECTAQTKKPANNRAKKAPPKSDAKTSVDENAARDFVINCYQTYQQNKWNVVDDFKLMKDWFTPALYKLILKDTNKEEGNLDFDPLYNAQDAPNSYKIGNVTGTGNKALVQVTVFFGDDTVEVEVEVVKSGDKWQIDNFIYQPDSNLVEILTDEDDDD